MKLSPHFTLAELTCTNTGLDNTPPPSDLVTLKETARQLEKVRAILGGHPIIVTSCYRNERVNRAVGGVATSDHRKGYAVDFKHSKFTAKQCCEAIYEAKETGLITFDQLILERKATLVHISFNPRFRAQVLRQPGGPGSKVLVGLG